MERNEMLEQRNEEIRRRHANRNDHLTTEQKSEGSGAGMIALGVVGGIALVGVAALVVLNLPDLKRYIKISSM